ncbi:MAG: hypothetical protein ABI186_10665 [Candidatus Elarobacter sp.]
MKKNLISALAACAVLAMPAYALADAMPGHDAMAHDAMAHDAMAHSSATMLCRSALGKEHPTGMLMDFKSTPIVCKTMNGEMMMNGKGGPDLSKALTSAQVDAAWRAYVTTMINVSGDGGG